MAGKLFGQKGAGQRYRWFSWGRLKAVFAKEFIQMRRDRVTFAMMLGVPLMQLVLFGYAINSDPRGLPTAVFDASRDETSRAVLAALELTNYYRFTEMIDSAEAAENLLASGQVSFVISIPPNFSGHIARGETPQVLIQADATDPAASSGALSVLSNVVQSALLQPGQDSTASQPFEFVVHKLYNPEAISQYNIVPGLLGVILQMTMVMMTSMALTRERERGTMENLLAMPASPLEIMLGKVAPYLLVGAVQVVVVLLAARWLFSVPFVGALPLLLVGIMIFVLSLVVLGYAISTAAKTQMQAMQLTFFFFLPSLMLSGFMFPFLGMPIWAQYLGEIFPLTHFLRVVRGVMLKGADTAAIGQEMWILVLFVLIYGAVALKRFNSKLD